METYRRKPAVVRATRITVDNAGVFRAIPGVPESIVPGDWLVLDHTGTYSTCDPGTFAAAYEPHSFILPGPVRETPQPAPR